MKKTFKAIAVIVLLVLASGAIVYFFIPEILVDQIIYLNRFHGVGS